MSGMWTKLRDGTLSARDALRDKASVSTVRLAVTGLSGAGKTVFLVSVISNLLAMVRGAGGKRWDSLPRLREALTNPQGQSRLLGIEIEPSGAGLIPRFPYEAFRDVLASGNGQGWPRSTEKPALITLRLRVQPRSTIQRIKEALGPQIIRLELLDYPGEWLVDLPLLEQTYHSWSAETLLRLYDTLHLPVTVNDIVVDRATNGGDDLEASVRNWLCAARRRLGHVLGRQSKIVPLEIIDMVGFSGGKDYALNFAAEPSAFQ